MNSKERLKHALAGLPTDVPAVAPCYLELFLENQINQYYLAAYEHKLGSQSSCAIDHEEDALFRVEAILKAYRLFENPPDWMHLAYAPLRSWAQEGRIEQIEGRLFYTNTKTGALSDLQEAGEVAFPTSLRFFEPPSTRTDYWQTRESLRTRVDVDVEVPVIPVEELFRQGIYEVARMLVEKCGDEVYLRSDTGTPYWNTYYVLGFEQMMTSMRTNPDLFRYIMQRKHIQRLEILKGFAATGAQGVWVEELLSSADLISKRDYETFVYPTTRAYLEDIKSLGIDSILYFGGDGMARLPYLRQLPVNAIAVEESKKNFTVNIDEVIREIGNGMCVFGNVDAVNVVQQGTEAEIYREVKRQIDIGKQARSFVLCQGSPFPLDMDLKKIDQLIRFARE